MAAIIIVTFIIGVLIGYLICMTQWIMQLDKNSTSIDIEIAKIKAALREEVEDDTQ